MFGPGAILVLIGCSDYAVNPHGVGPDSPASTPGLSGQPPLRWSAGCTGVDVPAVTTAGLETCDTVTFAGWDLAVEWEAASHEAAFPMVLPDPEGHSDLVRSKMGAGFSFLDGNGGAERHWFPTRAHRDDSPVAFARQVTGQAMASWREPGDSGGAFTSWWSESDATVVSSAPVDWLAGTVRWLDIDADGAPEILGHSISVRSDGTTIAYVPGLVSFDTAMTANGDFNNDGRMMIASTDGIWDALTGEITPWAGLSGYTFQAAPVLIDGEIAFLGTDGSGAFRAKPDGEVVWRMELHQNDEDGIAVGDVDGDAIPEMAVNTYGELFLIDAEGVKRWSVHTMQPEAGSVVMADLDADGTYEVIAYGNSGLRILSGADGMLLAEDSTIYNGMSYASPAVADVDGDGSAEIVVVGQTRGTGDWVVRVEGPATGSWARTRPVWNELDYDVTTVQDDGRLAVWPIPSWESYNSFRAQPAHDGPHPDLTVAATDLCCDDETVQLAVQTSNLGSVDSLAGATVTLSTNDGTGWRAVASQVLASGVDAHTAAAGFVFEVPRADWGNLQVLQVTGTGGDECDFVNDRIQVVLECAD